MLRQRLAPPTPKRTDGCEQALADSRRRASMRATFQSKCDRITELMYAINSHASEATVHKSIFAVLTWLDSRPLAARKMIDRS